MRTRLRSLLCATATVSLALATLGPAGQAAGQGLKLVHESTVDDSAITFSRGTDTRWSSFVNGRSFQQYPLTTHGNHQYVVYVNSDRQICVGRRELPTGDWEVIRFDDYAFEGFNSHDTSVIGVCANDGTIHLAFDHHREDLNYRVSKPGVATHPENHPWDASLFLPVTDELVPLGKQEEVTYPRFIAMPDGNLMFYRRDVTSGNGDSVIRVYDGKKGQWRDSHGKIVARDIGLFVHEGEVSQYRYAYFNAIRYSGDRLHASWVWRDRFKRTDVNHQHDLCYMYSDDDGLSWHNSDGELIGLVGTNPVHLDSPGLTVHPIPVFSGVSNQNGHYAYPDGSVHVILPRFPEGTSGPDARRMYHHHWRDASGKWHVEEMGFEGSRPEVVGDDDRNLYLIYGIGSRMEIAQGTPNSDHTAWTWKTIASADSPNPGGEPQIDFDRWERDRVLSVYWQEGPDAYLGSEDGSSADGKPSPLKVFDFALTSQ